MRIVVYLVILMAGFIRVGFAQTYTNVGVTNLPNVGNSQATSWADVNNDGLLDILIAGDDGLSNIYTKIFRNNGDDTFTDIGANLPELFGGHAVWRDFNNDGLIDLLLNGTQGDGTVVTDIFINNGDESFTALNTGISPLSSGGLITGDFNNDGKTDVFTYGLNSGGNRISQLYQNNGDNTYSVTPTIIPGISSGDAASIDFNNDGRLDILITGVKTNGQHIHEVYKNLGDFVFTSVATPFDKITSGDIAIGDFNSDGFDDVVLAGFNSSGSRISKLYKNNGNETFTIVSTSFTALSDGTISLSDNNNDGWLDLVLTGIDDSGDYQTLFYENNGDDTFTEVTTSIDGRIYGQVSLADFDSDGALDVLVTGFATTGVSTDLFRNTIATTNNKPSAPTSLMANSSDDMVTLTWDQATDDLTNVNALSYNLYAGSATETVDILAPESTIPGGLRSATWTGNAHHNQSFKLDKLQEGIYYWSVQAIDNSFQGSAFASEGSFTICHDFSIGSDTTVCIGATVPLSAGTASDIVNWYSTEDGLLSADNNNFDFVASKKDTVIAEITKPLGCTIYDSLIVDVFTLPDFTIGANTAVCYDEQITLDVGSGYDEVNWYSTRDGLLASSSQTYNHLVQSKDTLIAEVYNANRCLNYDSIVVDVIDLPAFDLGPDTAVCFEEDILLSTGAGWDEVNWYSTTKGLLQSGNESFDYTALEKDTLFAEVFNAARCVQYDSIVIDITALPAFELGADTAICFNGNILLDVGSGWDEVNWFSKTDGILKTNSPFIDYQVTTKDTVIAEVFNASRCVNYDTLVIDKIDLPVVNIGADTAVCFEQNILLEAGSSWDEVNWYSAKHGLLLEDNENFDYQVLEKDTLVAEVFNASRCVNYDSIVIDVIGLPIVDLGPDQSICYKERTLLDVGSGWDEVNWYSISHGILKADDPSFDYQVLEKDTLISEVYNASRCVYYDSLVIDVIALPAIDIGADTAICFNENILLDAGTGWDEVNWLSTSQGILQTNNSTFDYKVLTKDTLVAELYNASRCVEYDSIIIDVINLPDFELGEDVTACFGESVTFDVGTGWTSVNWYNINNELLLANSDSLQVTANDSKTLIAEVFNNSGCVSYDTVSVGYYEVPILDAGADRALCNNESTQLGGEPTAVGAGEYSYLWEPSAGLNDPEVANPIANPEATTEYILSAITENGCIFKDSVLLQVDPASDIEPGADREICIGDETELGGQPTASGSALPYEFEWSPSSSLNSDTVANPLASPLETTTYALITKTGGCVIDTSTVTIIVNPLPQVVTSDDFTIGREQSATLSASGGVEYHWEPFVGLNFNDIADPVVSPDETTSYTVTVTDENSCQNQDSVVVRVKSEIFIPNLFTPNNDGNNDTFKVFGTGIDEMTLRVYNRHSQLVFETTDPSQGWDGFMSGRQAESDNYVWTIEGRFFNGEPINFQGKNTGIVKLVR